MTLELRNIFYIKKTFRSNNTMSEIINFLEQDMYSTSYLKYKMKLSYIKEKFYGYRINNNFILKLNSSSIFSRNMKVEIKLKEFDNYVIAETEISMQEGKLFVIGSIVYGLILIISLLVSLYKFITSGVIGIDIFMYVTHLLACIYISKFIIKSFNKGIVDSYKVIDEILS